MILLKPRPLISPEEHNELMGWNQSSPRHEWAGWNPERYDDDTSGFRSLKVLPPFFNLGAKFS